MEAIIYKIHNSLPTYPKNVRLDNEYYKVGDLFRECREHENKLLFVDKNQRELSYIYNDRYGNFTGVLNQKGFDQNHVKKELDLVDSMVNSQLTGIYRNLSWQYGLAIKALYAYKCGDFYNAAKLSLECIDIVDDFIEMGCKSFIFRSIEMNKNLATIQYRINNGRVADRIHGDILTYFFHNRNEGLYGAHFDNEDVWNEYPYIREWFCYFSLMDHAKVIYDDQYDDTRLKAYLSNVLREGFDFEANSMERYVLKKWVKLQQHYFAENDNSFLNGFHFFFQEDLMDLFNPLRLSLLRQLKSVSIKYNYQLQKKFEFDIDDYIFRNKLLEWSYIPPSGKGETRLSVQPRSTEQREI